MDDVRDVLQKELQAVTSRLRDLGGVFLVEDGVALDDEDELTEAGAGGTSSGDDREIGFAVGSLLMERANRLAEALDRLRSGEYGLCATCQGPIAAPRLRAMPEVTTCLACQHVMEQVACRAGSTAR
jgi:RNA polymerase-binding transcription factor